MDNERPSSLYMERMAALIGQNYLEVQPIRTAHSDTTLASSDPAHSSGASRARLTNGSTLIENMTVDELRTELLHVRAELRTLVDSQHAMQQQWQRRADNELHDFTEQVFQDANKRINAAEVRRQRAEQSERQAQLTIEVLQEEIRALKRIVERLSKGGRLEDTKKPFFSSVTNLVRKGKFDTKQRPESTTAQVPCSTEAILVNPTYYRELEHWRTLYSLNNEQSNMFIYRLYNEEIYPTLGNLTNKQLREKVLAACENNALTIEQAAKNETLSSRDCALLGAPCICPYRLVLNNETPLSISTLARNQIVAVCNLLNHLRYLRDGIIRVNMHDCYEQMMRLRHACALARYGFAPEMAEMPFKNDSTCDSNTA